MNPIIHIRDWQGGGIILRKFILVYNPISGDASFKFKLDNVIEAFQKKDCIIIPLRVSNDQESDAFIMLVKEIAVDGIIVSGGDGTIHSVINNMLKQEIDLPLGIIPSGTSNDFAVYLQLDKNIDTCVETITKGQRKRIDVGKVND